MNKDIYAELEQEWRESTIKSINASRETARDFYDLSVVALSKGRLAEAKMGQMNASRYYAKAMNKMADLPHRGKEE